MKRRSIITALALLALPLFSSSARAEDKSILLIAGKISHGKGAHEHNAGMLLLQKCLKDTPGVKAEVHLNGWPQDAAMLDNRAAIVMFSDGGGGHMATQGDNLKNLGQVIAKGTGLGAIHYAVEPTRLKGQKEFLEWIGGAFEINWSVNPHWSADFTKFPDHPVARGVKPFKVNDEWYFNMRFREGMKGVTPILSAVAPDETMQRGDGSHSGNPDVRKAVAAKEPQHMMWVSENEGGSRGFGFTGAHNHANWGDESFRKVVLNAILWVAKVEVPAEGVASKLTPEDLTANLDPKK